MKKGFTLVELIAVVAILGLIAAIVYPSINSIIKSSKDDSFESQKKVVLKAAQEWGVDNVNLLPNSGKKSLTLSALINGGYIANDELKDPRDGKQLKGCVMVEYTSNQYKYSFEESESVCNSTSKLAYNSSSKLNHNTLVLLNSQDGYFKGSNPNNYLLFSDILWRVLRVNDDGSFKIVSDDYNISLNVKNDDELMDYLENTVYPSLDEDKIVLDNYCLDGMCDENKIGILNLADIENASNNLNCTSENINECYVGNFLTDYSKQYGDEYISLDNHMLKDGKLDLKSDENLVIRPVITISGDSDIKGTGSKKSPYVVI